MQRRKYANSGTVNWKRYRTEVSLSQHSSTVMTSHSGQPVSGDMKPELSQRKEGC